MDFRLLELVAALWTMGIIDGFRLLGACCRSLGQWALLMDFRLLGACCRSLDNGIIDGFRLLELVAASWDNGHY